MALEFVDTSSAQNPQEYYNSLFQDLNGGKPLTKYGDRSWEARKDWAAMYYENAYNTALLNYQNEYNSPLQQMLRYQEAGLNPFLAAQDSGNMGSTHPGATPRGGFTAPSSLDTIMKTIGGINDTVKTASQLYDYIRYGAPTNQLQMDIARYNMGAAEARQTRERAEADWALYWNYGEDMGPNSVYVNGSPRAQYMANSTAYKAAQIEQLESLVKVIYPAQEEQMRALAALNDYKKQVMEGQYGAALNIDTGNKTADGILQLLAIKLLSMNFGFTGKMF